MTSSAAINSGCFKKGEIRPNQGKRGPAKTTREFREVVNKLLQDNAENVGVWLAQVANGHGDTKAQPEKALDLLAKLAEFAAPKLGRTEIVGDGGGPLTVEIVRFGEDQAA